MTQKKINQAMIKAALLAGKILKSAFDSNTTREKSKSSAYYDVVSKADFMSEKVILKTLASQLPEINILSEEKGFIDRRSPDTIIVDPLDGSSNFLLGLPHFSVSLAHLHLGEVVASVVYNPVLNKLYFAEKGKGAYLNNKKLVSSGRSSSAYVAVNFSSKAEWKEKRKFFDWAYGSGFSRILNNWSPNLDYCLLAEGKIDTVVSLESLIYDFAPGFLIAKESSCSESPKLKGLNNSSRVTCVIANKKPLLAKISPMVQ